MSVQYLNIAEKHRQMTGFAASIADFSVTSGATADASSILTNPNVSLYCLDDANRQAIFVELPPGIDLATAPFVYQMQYEQAERLIAVPYDTFREVAQSLPRVQHLILMFISGRSGSTLLSHVFNQLDSVVSLSEPDVLTQFVGLRHADGSRDAELSDLLDCTVRMLFKPNGFKTPTTYALKFRSEVTQLMGLFQAAFPQAKNLYLYRDAVGFVSSFYRIFKSAGFPEAMSRDEYISLFSQINNYDFAPIVRKYFDADATHISSPQQLTLWWMTGVEWYLAQYGRGISVLAVRYADLNAAREQTLSAIFDYCGLPTAQVAQTLSVFDRDSQVGTTLAREKPTEGNALRLTEAQLKEITTILERHPIIRESDFVVPGTLRL